MEILWGSTREPELNATLGEWCRIRIGLPRPFASFTSLGVFQDGELLGAAVFHNYEPESGVDLNATYPDSRAKWVLMSSLADGVAQNLSGNIAATYLFRTVTSPSARTMTLGIGSNDAIKLWINGQVVLDPSGDSLRDGNPLWAHNHGDIAFLMTVTGPNSATQEYEVHLLRLSLPLLH